MKKTLRVRSCVGAVLLSAVGLAQNSWTLQTPLIGLPRSASFAFTMNGKAYVGGGMNFSNTPIELSDFYEYDPVLNSWTPKAPFGGGGRSAAVAFSVGGKGYVLTGIDTNTVKQNDLWEYDPSGNSWTQKTSLPAAGRNYAVAFAVGAKGYIATGYDASGNNLDDCWEYDPSGNSWLQRTNVPGGLRSSAIAFSIGSKGYVGTGYGAAALNDFYEFDPAMNSWTPRANVGTNQRSDGTAFAINGYGYVCTGSTSLGVSNDLLRYDPVANSWTSVAPLPGSGKSNPVGFSVNGYGYVGLGFDNGFSPTVDLYKYAPDTNSTLAVHEAENAARLFVYPNPVTSEGVIEVNVPGSADLQITICTAEGREVFSKMISASEKPVLRFSRNDLAAGIYFVQVKSEKRLIATQKLIME